MVTKIYAHRFLVENLKERDYLEDVSVDGRLIFKWMLKK
jgi:hypothetical protein